ncbi:MAG: hypothetical protein J5693_01215 [Bacteroidales bacterium]|nr:hypothetical protein [Bacteroidales bacterium]
MKRIVTLVAALVCSAALFAQTATIPVVKEIVTIENDNTHQMMGVDNIPVDGVNHYYLDVGNMGIGNKIVQIEVDPVYRLYIPLGDNLTDAIKAMEELKTLYKEPKGTMREIQGNFKPFFPTQELETVKVYKHRPFLTNQLQFVIERDGYLRVAYIDRADFNNMLRGVKLYAKLHPSEK